MAEDPAAGTIEVAFTPDARMLNPQGPVQGGFVAAMLDDTMGPALVSMSGGKVMPSSVDLTVSFIRPVRPGRVIGRGRVV
ncbi:PaaI family thioesterase, partial [Acinetobacter baumannii]